MAQNQRMPPFAYPSPMSHPAFIAFNKYIESYVHSYAFKLKKDELKHINKSILRRINEIQRKLNEHQQHPQTINQNGTKRKRRLADDIQRVYLCHADRCNKTYGTLGSLQQHQRLKHPQIVIESSSDGSSNQ